MPRGSNLARSPPASAARPGTQRPAQHTTASAGITWPAAVRTARTNKKLADGSFYQPTPNSKSPAEVVSRVLTPLFKK